MGNIDPAYMQSTEHRPKSSAFVQVDEIPTIDLSESIEQKLVSNIGKACEEWGFFQVINHGVPSDIILKAENETKKFFELSMEEKKKVKRDEVNATGYHDVEHTKNIRDWKEIFDYHVENATQVPSSDDPHDLELWTLKNQWPKSLPNFRETMEEYAREVEKLSYKLLELISLSLGLPGDKFHDCFKNQLSLMRLNRYPPCPFPDLALGIGPHKDPSALTVLAQDEIGGLQVQTKSLGDWIPVKPIPGALIINLGDIVQFQNGESIVKWQNGQQVEKCKDGFLENEMELAVGAAAVTVVVVTLMPFDRKPEMQSQDQAKSCYVGGHHAMLQVWFMQGLGNFGFGQVLEFGQMKFKGKWQGVIWGWTEKWECRARPGQLAGFCGGCWLGFSHDEELWKKCNG
ncbi:hypothetical protein KIW84_063018 [Lathyrus oleraceus]|uniref:Fe2OG dioxygenase domain-containing protein n=1 Tax=Pisum sativum TaxID=3888 RepID=A0A9D5A692_PEA|nr:hypothetical protein KIW84_063018 [Pisum sativum]